MQYRENVANRSKSFGFEQKKKRVKEFSIVIQQRIISIAGWFVNYRQPGRKIQHQQVARNFEKQLVFSSPHTICIILVLFYPASSSRNGKIVQVLFHRKNMESQAIAAFVVGEPALAC